ncbi:PadR family transcriptional regulator [Actinokineospora guangxiensis]|uniref:PadR family transcriptional regulator n=1 Tax=Actinokineospora guangxiensis TaxID=1490288 RepID=A0ABW0ET23_9PSEU
MVLAHIILGFLALAPMTGYDLKRHFDSTVGHFWSADRAQIYRALATLVADGHAEVETVAGSGAPDRQEHRVTDAGRAALAAWLAAEPERHVDRDPFLARVFFGADLAPDALLALLARRRAEAQTRLADYERLRAESDTGTRAARLRLATLDNGIAHLRAELTWLDAVTEEFA